MILSQFLALQQLFEATYQHCWFNIVDKQCIISTEVCRVFSLKFKVWMCQSEIMIVDLELVKLLTNSFLAFLFKKVSRSLFQFETLRSEFWRSPQCRAPDCHWVNSGNHGDGLRFDLGWIWPICWVRVIESSVIGSNDGRHFNKRQIAADLKLLFGGCVWCNHRSVGPTAFGSTKLRMVNKSQFLSNRLQNRIYWFAGSLEHWESVMESLRWIAIQTIICKRKPAIECQWQRPADEVSAMIHHR